MDIIYNKRDKKEKSDLNCYTNVWSCTSFCTPNELNYVKIWWFETSSLKDEERGSEGRLARVAMAAGKGGEDEEDEELEEELEKRFERLLSFFFSTSHTLFSILWWPTFVEFKWAGIMQWQSEPKREKIDRNIMDE